MSCGNGNGSQLLFADGTEHPNGSVYPLNDDSGQTGWVCVNCGDGIENGKPFKGDR